jgi:hypothetical protein
MPKATPEKDVAALHGFLPNGDSLVDRWELSPEMRLKLLAYRTCKHNEQCWGVLGRS